jgi:3-hydroxy-9,10-secoandrosta-1,3,5(10)-triene-9,17-dione monooxygenase
MEIVMTSSPSKAGLAPLLPPEPQLTPRQMIARATALRPRLIAEQAATEERTYYSQEMHEEFVKAGFYRLYIPKRFGGYEFDFPTFVRVTIELARGCASTAWCWSLSAAHALQLSSWFDERAQTDILGQGGHFAMASAAQPIGMAKRTDDGWELNGKAAFCSGIPYSTHYMGQALMPNVAGGTGAPAVMLFIVPKKHFTILNDWGSIIGLKGSGSHSIEIHNARIPAYWAIENAFVVDHDVSKGTPGLRFHGNPMYGGRGSGTFTGNLAAVVVGMAYSALDEYAKMLDTKKTGLPPYSLRRHDADYQRWYGAALARIATAEAALLNMADQHMEACYKAAQEGEEFTYFKDSRNACIAREVMIQCWDVMQSVIWRTAGSHAGAKGERIERIYRDMSTANGHRNVTFQDYFHKELALAGLGLRNTRPQPEASRPQPEVSK